MFEKQNWRITMLMTSVFILMAKAWILHRHANDEILATWTRNIYTLIIILISMTTFFLFVKKREKINLNWKCCANDNIQHTQVKWQMVNWKVNNKFHLSILFFFLLKIAFCIYCIRYGVLMLIRIFHSVRSKNGFLMKNLFFSKLKTWTTFIEQLIIGKSFVKRVINFA